MTALTQTDMRFRTLLRHGFCAHGIFLLPALGFVVSHEIASRVWPQVGQGSFLELGLGIATFSIPIAFVSLAIYIFAQMVMTDRPDKPIKVLWQRVTAVLKNHRIMAAGIPMFVSLIIFMFAFTAFKAAIPIMQPFQWDKTFDAWDVALHFGFRPYELLQPILGFAPITFLLNLNYNMWFIVMNLFWVHFAFLSAPSVERTRFFLAFMLIVASVGTVLATVFSSAGPCYFTRIGLSPDPYAPLMNYLHNVHQNLTIWAVDTQDMLWRYQQEKSIFGGISAMPSVHNATALLFVLAVWNKGVILRRLMIIHAVLIFLASIHLGWHYAVDSYLAWPVTLACWWAAGKLAKCWHSRAHVKNFEEKVKA